jgi:toxin secretion/phage lysis holin
MDNFIKAITGAMAGLGAYICGLNWELLTIWGILANIDIITGVIKAKKNADFNSHDMKIGLWKKCGELFLIIALIFIQRVAEIVNISVPIGNLFVGAFCFKEFGSIIENAIGMDIDLPIVVTKWFKVANAAANQFENGKDENHGIQN